jgi:hypothetical protein
MSAQLRWRKFSPIDRDWPIFELVAGEVIILDVTKGNDASLEIVFHEGALGRSFDLPTIERFLAEVKTLLAEAG